MYRLKHVPTKQVFTFSSEENAREAARLLGFVVRELN
jgi:hypothetical protein